MHGTSNLRGSMVIEDPLGHTSAYADDINLTGGYTAVIRLYNNVPGVSRAIQFGDLDFLLNKPTQ
jgi:hypothetical protein